MRQWQLWLTIVVLSTAGPLIAAPPSPSHPEVVVAILDDGIAARQASLEPLFREELLALTEGEIEVRFKVFSGQWQLETTRRALQRAYDDPEVDMVLVTGLTANQLVAQETSFAKPTFLPLVFDAALLALPRQGQGSGITHLSYLADEMDFFDHLAAFHEVVPFRRVGLLVDAFILKVSADVVRSTLAVGSRLDVEIVPIAYEDPEGDLLSLIPSHVEAIMVGGLERLSEAAIDRLVEGLAKRRLPSFSLAGDSFVRRGLLASATSDADWQRLARRTALNMQAVMLGEEAARQPVDFRSKRRLYVNLQTAQILDVWPTYDVLVEAVLVDDDPGAGGLGWDIAQVAEEAVRINQELLAQQLATDAGALEVRLARTRLLPQISADLSWTELDGGSPSVAAGAIAKRSTDAALTLSQVVWSEPILADRDIQQHLQAGREAELERFRLDTLQAATVTFLDILRADTQVRVQRDNLERIRANLELARDRVRVGSSSRADVYRWQRELATARQTSIDAYTQRTVAREALNRLLHRPLTEPFIVVMPSLDDPYLLMSEGGLRETIDNPKSFRRLTELQIQRGLERSPELASLKASVAALKRQRLSLERQFFSPTVSLQGQLSYVLEEQRISGISQQGESDASLAVVASLPLFTGGSRRLDGEQLEVQIRQLEVQITALRERIEQGIRSNMHLANASYNNIALAQQAAEAAAKNLELITSSYSQGVVSILDLLDAQSAALQSEESAANSVFDFLIDLMNAQRATGVFDFFLSDQERQLALLELQRFLASEEDER